MTPESKKAARELAETLRKRARVGVVRVDGRSLRIPQRHEEELVAGAASLTEALDEIDRLEQAMANVLEQRCFCSTEHHEGTCPKFNPRAYMFAILKESGNA